jgi:hypothetical protein
LLISGAEQGHGERDSDDDDGEAGALAPVG